MTKAEREARRAFRQVDAEKAMTEHEIARKPGTSQGRAAGAGSCRDASRGQKDQEEVPSKIIPARNGQRPPEASERSMTSAEKRTTATNHPSVTGASNPFATFRVYINAASLCRAERWT